MKWIVIQRIHINTDRILSFHWIEGRLFIKFGGEDSLSFRDRDRKLYSHLCHCLGVNPVEEGQNGEG